MSVLHAVKPGLKVHGPDALQGRLETFPIFFLVTSGGRFFCMGKASQNFL